MCSQGADPLSDLPPFPPETQNYSGLNLDPSSRYLDYVEVVILGEVLFLGKLSAYQVSYVLFFSAHMTFLGATN